MEIVFYHRTFIRYGTHILSIVKTSADHEADEGKVIPRITQTNFYAAAPRGSLLYKGQGVAIAFKALKGFIPPDQDRSPAGGDESRKGFHVGNEVKF